MNREIQPIAPDIAAKLAQFESGNIADFEAKYMRRMPFMDAFRWGNMTTVARWAVVLLSAEIIVSTLLVGYKLMKEHKSKNPSKGNVSSTPSPRPVHEKLTPKTIMLIIYALFSSVLAIVAVNALETLQWKNTAIIFLVGIVALNIAIPIHLLVG
jgi:hypothetical protein